MSVVQTADLHLPAAKKKNNRKLLIPYLFIAPAILFFLIVTIIPTIAALPISLSDWNVISTDRNWVGFDNYAQLMDDSVFWKALTNTLIYTVTVVPGVAILALVFALMLNMKIRFRSLFRLMIFSPVITSMIAVAVVWSWLYEPNFGLFNYILELLGLPKLAWLKDPSTSLLSIIILSIWKDVGYQMIIFLAGLQGIPTDLYEAADIDGANRWQKFRNITLPLLRPTTLFVMITSLISAFMVFQQVYIFREVTPLDSATVLVSYIQETGFRKLEMGYASAMAIVLFVIVMIITAIQWTFFRKDVSYD